MEKIGNLLVVSGPSGAGKGTVVRETLERVSGAFLSVSMTTRPPRPEEIPGVSYHYVTPDEFESHIADGDFLEWAQYGGHYYGTPRGPVQQHLARGHLVFLEIEVQGALRVKETTPEARLVFLTSTSFAEVERRLRLREAGRMSEEKIRRRLDTAQLEYRQIGLFDYIVLNDDLDRAVHELQCICTAEGCRRVSRAHRIKSILGENERC